MVSNLGDNYKTEENSQTCSAWRKFKTPSNTIRIKSGTAYKVKTGYKIYASTDKANPTDEGNGVELEFTWESAIALTASGAAFASALFF